MSADEDEFVSQAGMMAATSSGEFAPRGRTERALDAMFNATGLHAVADFLRGNAAGAARDRPARAAAPHPLPESPFPPPSPPIPPHRRPPAAA